MDSRWLLAALLWPLVPARAGAQPASELEIASDPQRPTQVGPAVAGSSDQESPRPHQRGHFPEGLFLPVGVGFASTSHPRSPTALSFGAEASVAVFPVGHGNWSGAYFDVFQEPKNDLTRASIGLEAGFVFLGVDGGLVMQTSDAGTHWGGVLRPMLTMGLLSLYGRWGWLKGDEDFREFGVLLKFPIQLMELDLNEPPPAPPVPRGPGR